MSDLEAVAKSEIRRNFFSIVAGFCCGVPEAKDVSANKHGLKHNNFFFCQLSTLLKIRTTNKHTKQNVKKTLEAQNNFPSTLTELVFIPTIQTEKRTVCQITVTANHKCL